MVISKKGLVLFGLFGIALLVAVTGSYLAFREDGAKRKRLTAEVPAVITRVDERIGTNTQTGIEQVIDVSVVYQYFINEIKHEKIVRLQKSETKLYAARKLAKVCFNPQESEEAELFPIIHKCGE